MSNTPEIDGTERAGPAQPQLPVREPAFNLPGSLIFILSALVVIHVLRLYALSADMDNELLYNFAFLPARYDYPLSDQGWAWLWSPITYSFLHGGWEHLVFNAFWLVAFGAPVARRIGPARLAVFWCLAAPASVAMHVAFHWGEEVIVIGASGVVSALMGAAARFVFSPNGGIERQDAHLNARLSIPAALSNRSVLTFAAIWLVTNYVLGSGLLGGVSATGPVAWEAHMGGFLFGFLLFGLFDANGSYRFR